MLYQDGGTRVGPRSTAGEIPEARGEDGWLREEAESQCSVGLLAPGVTRVEGSARRSRPAQVPAVGPLAPRTPVRGHLLNPLENGLPRHLLAALLCVGTVRLWDLLLLLCCVVLFCFALLFSEE